MKKRNKVSEAVGCHPLDLKTTDCVRLADLSRSLSFKPLSFHLLLPRVCPDFLLTHQHTDQPLVDTAGSMRPPRRVFQVLWRGDLHVRAKWLRPRALLCWLSPKLSLQNGLEVITGRGVDKNHADKPLVLAISTCKTSARPDHAAPSRERETAVQSRRCVSGRRPVSSTRLVSSLPSTLQSDSPVRDAPRARVGARVACHKTTPSNFDESIDERRKYKESTPRQRQ